MTSKKTFKTIFENKNQITATHEDDLRLLSNKYPYCQILRAFYTKSIKDKNFHLFKSNLSIASIYTRDREALFYFINDIQKNTSLQNSSAIKDNPAKKDKVIPSPLVEKIKTDIHSKDKTTTNYEKNPKSEENINVTPIGNDSALLEQNLETSSSNNTTTMPFEEWLEHMDKTKLKTPKSNISSLPDSKISTEVPKLDKDSKASKVNLAKKRNLEKLDFMTETLAKTYVEQHKYDSAIEAYEVLILKNPKKSNYFASKITSIKNLKKQKL